MPRPRNAYKKVEIKLGVNPYILDQVKWICKQHGVSQSEIFAQIINTGLSSYYKNIGFTSAHKAILKNYTDSRIMYGIDDLPTVI